MPASESCKRGISGKVMNRKPMTQGMEKSDTSIVRKRCFLTLALPA